MTLTVVAANKGTRTAYVRFVRVKKWPFSCHKCRRSLALLSALLRLLFVFMCAFCRLSSACVRLCVRRGAKITSIHAVCENLHCDLPSASVPSVRLQWRTWQLDRTRTSRRAGFGLKWKAYAHLMCLSSVATHLRSHFIAAHTECFIVLFACIVAHFLT